MICKHKIGNLHTSYQKMGDSYHLKGLFGVNVACSMNEILKFPGLFAIEELSQFLDEIKIISKKKLIIFNSSNSFISPKYLSESEAIIPQVIAISNIDKNIVYFYFDQHFEINDKRKYKVKIDVIDKTINKAIEAKEFFISSNMLFSTLKKEDNITEAILKQAVSCAVLAEKIQQKEKEIYKVIIETRKINLKILSELNKELKNEVRFIDNKLVINKRRFSNNNLKDNPKDTGLNVFSSFEKDFKKEISFSFKQEYRSLLSNRNSTELIKIQKPVDNIIDYFLDKKIKIKNVRKLPSFETTYSKRHLYDNEQSLRKKAENYNLEFVDKTDKSTLIKYDNFIENSEKEQIYVLNGHYENNVTSETFIPLSEINLNTGSTYLCKTEMVESENQFFVLET